MDKLRYMHINGETAFCKILIGLGIAMFCVASVVPKGPNQLAGITLFAGMGLMGIFTGLVPHVKPQTPLQGIAVVIPVMIGAIMVATASMAMSP